MGKLKTNNGLLIVHRSGYLGNKKQCNCKEKPLTPQMTELTEEQKFQQEIDEKGILLPPGFQFERKIAENSDDSINPLLPAGM